MTWISIILKKTQIGNIMKSSNFANSNISISLLLGLNTKVACYIVTSYVVVNLIISHIHETLQNQLIIYS